MVNTSLLSIMSEANPNSIRPVADVEARMHPFSKLRIIKNLVVVALGTLFVLGADDMALIFQSTMNREKSVGIVSVAIQYAFSFISSFFLPKYLVLKYGSKKIMILAIFMFMPFFVINYYPLYSLMLLTSTINGGFSLLWGSLNPYLNNLSNLYVDHQLANLLDKNAKIRKKANGSIDRYISLESMNTAFSFTDSCYELGSDIANETKTVVSDYNSSNKSNIATKLSKYTRSSNTCNMDIESKQKKR